MAGKQSGSSAGGTAEPSDEMDNEGIDTYFKVSQRNCTDWLSKYPQVIRKVQLLFLLSSSSSHFPSLAAQPLSYYLLKE